jgi:hypothetical protein
MTANVSTDSDGGERECFAGAFAKKATVQRPDDVFSVEFTIRQTGADTQRAAKKKERGARLALDS